MNKADKKLEKNLVAALTEACEGALHEVAGFTWLTHFVNYRQFPESLSVVCVFATDNDLANLVSTQKDIYVRSLIQEKLAAIDIHLKKISRHVHFDTEEACEREHAGKWHERFA